MRGTCSHFTRTCPVLGLEEEQLDTRRRRDKRKACPPTPVEDEEEEVVVASDGDRDKDGDDDVDEQGRHEEEVVECGDEDDKEDAVGTASASSTLLSVYLQGPVSLPPLSPLHRRPVIHPKGQK